MYIMCFNVSICFKMGSLLLYILLLWHNNKQVYPPELQDFVLILMKIFWGRTPKPPFQAEFFEPVL